MDSNNSIETYGTEELISVVLDRMLYVEQIAKEFNRQIIKRGGKIFFESRFSFLCSIDFGFKEEEELFDKVDGFPFSIKNGSITFPIEYSDKVKAILDQRTKTINKNL